MKVHLIQQTATISYLFLVKKQLIFDCPKKFPVPLVITRKNLLPCRRQSPGRRRSQSRGRVMERPPVVLTNKATARPQKSPPR